MLQLSHACPSGRRPFALHTMHPVSHERTTALTASSAACATVLPLLCGTRLLISPPKPPSIAVDSTTLFPSLRRFSRRASVPSLSLLCAIPCLDSIDPPRLIVRSERASSRLSRVSSFPIAIMMSFAGSPSFSFSSAPVCFLALSKINSMINAVALLNTSPHTRRLCFDPSHFAYSFAFPVSPSNPTLRTIKTPRLVGGMLLSSAAATFGH